MSTDEFIPTLTHATERDIDLLLGEELFSLADFVAWLAEKSGLGGKFMRATVLHSKRRTRSRREIDIFVDITTVPGLRCALLIENKLDEKEQPDQAESYREELARISESYSQSAMMVICPSSYAVKWKTFTQKFDCVVTYEALVEYFERLVKSGPEILRMRYMFRRDILNQAINKHRRGYVAVPNELVGGFNARYVSLLREVAPSIAPGPSMLKPANPDESTSMIFDHDASLSELPTDLRPRRFAHELGRGKDHRANYVAVTFPGWGRALPILRDRLKQDTRDIGAVFSAKPPTKARPNPGLVMSCRTEAVDNQADFTTQQSKIIAGILKAEKLRGWLLRNIATLTSWKNVVDTR